MNREEVRQDIERSKQALSAKVELLAVRAGDTNQRVRGKVQTTRDRLSVRYQYQQHPLLFFAASGLAGWYSYRLISRRRRVPARLQRSGEQNVEQQAQEILPHPHTGRASLVHQAARSATSALATAIVSGLVRAVFAALSKAGKPRAAGRRG